MAIGGGMGGYTAALAASGAEAVSAARGQVGMANRTADQLRSLGSTMSGQFAGNESYANQALADAFDPHKDIYNRYLGQVTDQTNSQEALRGIANTPYGAAVTSDSIGNFNADWQMQAVQREQAGAQAATALQQQRLAAQEGGGQLINAAGQLNISGAAELMQGYGIQGQDLSKAMQELTQMFGIQVGSQTSRDTALIGALSGGSGKITLPDMMHGFL